MRRATHFRPPTHWWDRVRHGRPRAGTVIVALTLLIPWIPRGARACSCAAPPPPQQALAEADAVFEARPFSQQSDGQVTHYRFEVDRIYKGELDAQVDVHTALQSASCGRNFQMGERYIVYAYRGPDGQWTDNLCTRTRTSKTAAEDLVVLGEGQPPPDPSSPEPTESTETPTEPPRIEPTPAAPIEPPPAEPNPRGCSMEKPHTDRGFAMLMLMGLAVAARRRRPLRS